MGIWSPVAELYVLLNYVTVLHKSGLRWKGWIYKVSPPPPHDLCLTTCPAHIPELLCSVLHFSWNIVTNQTHFFRGKRVFFSVPFKHTDCSHIIVRVLNVLFLSLLWATQKKPFPLLFPGSWELAIHNDWKRGVRIPEPSSFKSTGVHTAYRPANPREARAKTSVWLQGTDPFSQNAGNTKSQDCLVILKILSHFADSASLLFS